jgi:hypothetical protein
MYASDVPHRLVPLSPQNAPTNPTTLSHGCALALRTVCALLVIVLVAGGA